MAPSWRIDELAQRAGVTVDTIRYYAREHLLPPPERSGRHKLYGPEHLDRLTRIRDLQAQRFSLAAIRAVLDADQRGLLHALLQTYVGRVPDGLAAPVGLDDVHLAWAGSTEPGRPHYYRLQAPRLLVEWDNTQRDANHAHSVWRDPQGDFGLDVLARHRAAYH